MKLEAMADLESVAKAWGFKSLSGDQEYWIHVARIPNGQDYMNNAVATLPVRARNQPLNC